MKKLLLPIVLYSILCMNVLYAQKNVSHQNSMAQYKKAPVEFLRKAPPSVQEYYRAFDSLAHPTWQGRIHEKWSLNELKYYSSLIYDANEYDPLTQYRNEMAVGLAAKTAHKGPGTNSTLVFEQLKKRLPQKYFEMVSNSYWVRVTVEGIQSKNLNAEINPPIQEKIIDCKIIDVYKGSQINVGDHIFAYYLPMWGTSLQQGHEYILAFYQMDEEGDRPGGPNIALGGFSIVDEVIYPISNGYVTDKKNIFQLGNKVNLERFTSAIRETISDIKSWKELAN